MRDTHDLLQLYRFAPSKYDAADVVSVSALADYDGRPGGLLSGQIFPPGCHSGFDDTLAKFSNYNDGYLPDVIDIAAPGVCINSTVNVNAGSYSRYGGTSMAAPHVAGEVERLAEL